MTLIGLDIGYDRCGVSVVEGEEIVYTCLILTDKKLDIQARLAVLREDLYSIKKKYKPDLIGIERLFFHRKNTTFEKICMSKGVALELFHDCEIIELEPKKIKKEIIGDGNAGKEEIREVMAKLLNKDLSKFMDDVIDAMAISLYLLQKNKFEKLYNKQK